MSQFHLPLHESSVHPHTGQPLRALFVDRHGRPRFPIMGGAPDDPPKDEPPKDEPPKDDPPPKDEPPKDEPPGDLGFPKDTPVAEMTLEQQVAYHRHQSRKHEQRATEYRSAAGGKSAAEVQAELEQLRRDKMTADERAIDDAKRQAREAATSEFGPKAVRAALNVLLGDMPEEERNAEVDLLDLTKFLTADGDVDTDKVRRAAERISPADKGGDQRRRRDFGAGDRKHDKSSGVAGGRDLFKERRGGKTEPTTSQRS